MKIEEPFLTDPKQIKAWLVSMGVKAWSINTDGLVDVAGDVNLERIVFNLKRLPVKFGKVSGDFHCYNNRLASLYGVPEEVGGHFLCHYNQLASLDGSPKKVGGNFWCHHNLLVDFKGLMATRIVGVLGITDSSAYGIEPDNIIVSLDGLPKDLYGKVVGLDMQAMLELGKKRAASLSGDGVKEELSSEVALG